MGAISVMQLGMMLYVCSRITELIDDRIAETLHRGTLHHRRDGVDARLCHGSTRHGAVVVRERRHVDWRCFEEAEVCRGGGSFGRLLVQLQWKKMEIEKYEWNLSAESCEHENYRQLLFSNFYFFERDILYIRVSWSAEWW